MVKISEQTLKTRALTRTERQIAQRQRVVEEERRRREIAERQRLFEQEKEKISGMSEEEYREHYKTLPSFLQEVFVSPSEIEAGKQERGRSATEQVQARIIHYEKLKKQYEAEALKRGQRGESTERQEEKIAEVKEMLAQLHAVKPKAETGQYSGKDLIAYAQSKGQKELRVVEEKRSVTEKVGIPSYKFYEYKQEQVKKHRESVYERTKQIKELEEAGLKPVYKGKELVGFEDIIAKMSIPLKTLEKGYTRDFKLDTTLTLTEKDFLKAKPLAIFPAKEPSSEEVKEAEYFKHLGEIWEEGKLLKTFKSTYRRYFPEKPETDKLTPVKKISVSPTGEKGTAIIMPEYPESVKQMMFAQMKFKVETGVLASDIFKEYEKNLETLDFKGGDLVKLQSQIALFKAESLSQFREKYTPIKTKYEEELEIRQETERREKRWMIQDVLPFIPIGTLRTGWYKMKDYEKELTKKDWYKKTFREADEEEWSKELYKTQKEWEAHTGKELSIFWKKRQHELAGMTVGAYETFRTEPLTTTTKVGVVAGVTYGLSAIAPLVSIPTGSKLLSAISTTTKYGVVGLWGGSVAVRTAFAGTPFKRGRVLGEIGVREVVPITIGTVTGIKLYRATESALVPYLYRKGFIQPYKLTRMKTLTGKQKFPVGETRTHLKKFAKSRYMLPDERALISKGDDILAGYHAKAGKLPKKFAVQVGTSELPMQYYSPELSPHFLRLYQQPSYSILSKGWIPTAQPPQILRAYAKSIKKIPKRYKPKMSLKELRKALPDFEIKPNWYRQTAYLYEKGQKGIFYVPAKKSEIEAGLRYETMMRRLERSYWTRIPRQEFAKKFEGFIRRKRPEYVLRVKKFKWTKPSTWIDKLTGRKAGQFKYFGFRRKGVKVGIDKYLSEEMTNIIAKKKIKDILRTDKPSKREIKRIKEQLSSSYRDYSVSISSPSSYAYALTSSMIRSSSKSSLKSSSYISSSISSSTSSLSSSMSSISSSLSKSASSLSKSSLSYPKSYSYSYSYGKYPSPPPPITPPILFPFTPKKKKRRRKKLKYGLELLYAPTFTEKAIGFEPIKVDLKQAQRLLKKELTPFQLIKPVKLK